MIVAALFEPFSIWLGVRNDPDLYGRPLVAALGERVVHASTEARRVGIAPRMPLQGAKLRAAGLTVLPADAPLMADEWRALLSELYGLTPWLEPLGLGRVLLRATRTDAELLAATYRVRVGVAASRQIAVLAALAAFEGQTRIIPEGAEREFLDILPTRFLCGVGLSEKGLADLHWLNIATVGRLARWSKPQLRGYLGTEVEALLPYLKGPWDAKVPHHRPEVTVTASYDFEDTALEPYQFLPVVEHLASKLSQELGDRAARRLKVVASSGGVSFPASRLSKEAIKEAKTIYQLSVLTLGDTGAESLGFDALEVQLSALYRPAEQMSLWKQAQREKAIRAVSERFPRALVRAKLDNEWTTAIDECYRFVHLHNNQFVKLHDDQEVKGAPNPAAGRRRAEQPGPARALEVGA